MSALWLELLLVRRRKPWVQILNYLYTPGGEEDFGEGLPGAGRKKSGELSGQREGKCADGECDATKEFR